MDYQDPENKSCLREEPVYCDTMHSHVQNYKNITAWVKNPIMRAVMRIATMEAMNEDTPTMTLFFTLLNEVLQKVSGKPNYKFNPSHFYIDKLCKRLELQPDLSMNPSQLHLEPYVRRVVSEYNDAWLYVWRVPFIGVLSETVQVVW